MTNDWHGDTERRGYNSRVEYSSARDGLTAANAREHVPKRVENAVHRHFHRFEIMGVKVTTQHFALGGRMRAVCFDMDTEILIMLGFGESVMLLESIDFGFTD